MARVFLAPLMTQIVAGTCTQSAFGLIQASKSIAQVPAVASTVYLTFHAFSKSSCRRSLPSKSVI